MKNPRLSIDSTIRLDNWTLILSLSIINYETFKKHFDDDPDDNDRIVYNWLQER